MRHFVPEWQSFAITFIQHPPWLEPKSFGKNETFMEDFLANKIFEEERNAKNRTNLS